MKSMKISFGRGFSSPGVYVIVKVDGIVEDQIVITRYGRVPLWKTDKVTTNGSLLFKSMTPTTGPDLSMICTLCTEDKETIALEFPKIKDVVEINISKSCPQFLECVLSTFKITPICCVVD